LNPVGSGWSSFGVNIDFIIKFSILLDIEMVKVPLLAFAVSHNLVKGWFLYLVPVLSFVVESVGFWVVAAHRWSIIFLKIRFYSFLSDNLCICSCKYLNWLP
jgi:hypothetical protein